MNRLIYLLAVMATLCLYSCGRDDNKDDEPTLPGTAQDEPSNEGEEDRIDIAQYLTDYDESKVYATTENLNALISSIVADPSYSKFPDEPRYDAIVGFYEYANMFRGTSVPFVEENCLYLKCKGNPTIFESVIPINPNTQGELYRFTLSIENLPQSVLNTLTGSFYKIKGNLIWMRGNETYNPFDWFYLGDMQYASDATFTEVNLFGDVTNIPSIRYSVSNDANLSGLIQEKRFSDLMDYLIGPHTDLSLDKRIELASRNFNLMAKKFAGRSLPFLADNYFVLMDPEQQQPPYRLSRFELTPLTFTYEGYDVTFKTFVFQMHDNTLANLEAGRFYKIKGRIRNDGVPVIRYDHAQKTISISFVLDCDASFIQGPGMGEYIY